MGLLKLRKEIREERDAETEALIARNAERMNVRQMIFNDYMKEAWANARKILSASEVGDIEQYAVMLAELRCVDEWVIPPHWDGYLTCDVCGFMPCRREDDKKKVICCSWCTAHPPEPPSRFDEGEKQNEA